MIMPLDNESVLRTSADDLYELVKKRKKISIEEAAKILKLTQQTLQALVDFLVEEKIFGLEYKFTTPFVYLNKEIEKKQLKAPEETSFVKKLVTKEDFYWKAKQKGVFHEKIEGLWKKYLNQNLDNIKDEFYRKAKMRNIPEERLNVLWKKYMLYLI